MTTTEKTGRIVRATLMRDHTDVMWTIATDRPLRWLDGREDYPSRATAWRTLLIACLHDDVATLRVGAETFDVREAAQVDKVASRWVRD